jgi:hypothetical protein
MTDPRDQISVLLDSGWKVVGYTTQHHEMLAGDDVEGISHKILLQKDNTLRCYEVHFDGDEFNCVKETVLAPGKYK